MKITLVVPLLFALAACGSKTAPPAPTKYDLSTAEGLGRDNVDKAKEYHELAAAVKVKQAVLQGFVEGWNATCKAGGKTLQMGQDGDPACLPKPEAPPAPAQGVSVPAKK